MLSYNDKKLKKSGIYTSLTSIVLSQLKPLDVNKMENGMHLCVRAGMCVCVCVLCVCCVCVMSSKYNGTFIS